MTTRNFRVNNGLEVGDIVISASANTITGGATAAPSADGQFANKKYVNDQDANIASDTLTLTNKTLTAPKFADGGFIADANGNEALVFGTTASAVNEFKITNKDTGNSPILAAQGGDTNIGMALTAKGTGDIDLNAGADVNIPVNIGLTFAGTEKIESDGTDLTITVGSAGDINIGADIGLTFGNDGEKIEGDGTDLTINSSALLNLTAGTAIVVPSGIPLRFVDDNEKITSNGTALTINSGEDINLTCATGDVNIPANIGLTFGDDGEKIEGNGTNLTIASSGTCTITATGETIVTNDMRVAGNLTVDGTETIINTTTISVEDNVIEVNRNVSANSGMPTFSGLKVNRGDASTATEQDLFFVWDESFADDGTTIHGNAGGAFTALRSQSTGNSPQSDFSLVDVRANVVHAVSTSAQYADVAERFEADAPMAEGAVVEVGGEAEITETTSEMSENVFGVISTQPAYAMNAGAGNNDSHPFVAMTGRTPVRVAGAVTKGQRLVTSSIKGCARAVAVGESISPFNVIGRALENSSDTGIKLVNCAVRTNN
jgi:hypothetical protein